MRRMVGEAVNMNCVQSTVKHGGGGIMVWVASAEKRWKSLKKLKAD